MKTIRTGTALAITMAGLLASGASVAQSTWSGTWDWNTPCDPSTCAVTGPGPANAVVTATVSAYGAETSNGNFANAAIYTGSNSYLGVTSAGENANSPNHSIDNFRKNDPSSTCTQCLQGGADVAEALLINFTQAVQLTQVAVSWTWNDSDALIFRWDSGGAPNLLTTTPGSLPTSVGTSGSGWTLVSSGQFGSTNSNGSGGAGSLSIGNPSLYSSYWLVSTALGSSNNDGFKVSSFTGNVCKLQIVNGECSPGDGGNSGGNVPEPGTLALVAAAFFGLAGRRRRPDLTA